MVKFKARNVTAIAKAKEGLEMRISKKLATVTNKKECEGEDAERNDTTIASPSDTIVS